MMESLSNDTVNHPAHYTQGGMECIDAIEAAGSTDGEAIRQALVAFSGDNFVTGAMAFDENGDAKKDKAYIKVIENGAFKFIGTQLTDGKFTPVE